VAATNRNLEKMVAEREFRRDLFYRLNVFPVRIPPLLNRKDDIPLLVSFFAPACYSSLPFSEKHCEILLTTSECLSLNEGVRGGSWEFWESTVQ
jgi:transcriptional regulator with GAF, ATPase, and Fis domain